MDACDPGVDLANLRTLVKQNTGTELRLTRKEVCDVYASIQDGKLPLPPLILSKDGSYMIDRKSPLSRKEYKKLFSASTTVSSIRRIANKVGVARYADKKLTKTQLIDIIGRRLHSMNVREPIKLRSVQIKHIEKYSMNENVNNGLRGNTNNGLRGNTNNGLRGNTNNGLRGNVKNGLRENTNNGLRGNVKNGLGSDNFNKDNKKPNFLQGSRNNTSNGVKQVIRTFSKPKKPSFLNRSFIPTSKIKPMPGYVFKTGNKGLGMYRNIRKPVQFIVQGPVQGPARRPIEGPKVLENRNREIKENEILLRSYLNRENVSKYINNTEKTNAFNRVKRGTKFNNVKTYINGIVSTKITNEQRVQNQKIKLEQNRNELQKILSELTNLTNTNKNEILSKFNSNGKLNNAKTLAIQKDRDIKKSKLENLKSNLTTFLENKNVNNKGTYINRLNAGEDISNLKREILGVINKKNAERKNYDLKLRELRVLLNSSKNLNNSMKAKFLRNFEKTRNFNKVRKNVEDEFKKINEERKQGEITFRNADQKKLLQKILNNSNNFTNDDKRMFMQRLEAGNNFNTLKGNAIQVARNLAKKRKNRELEEKMKAESEYKEEQRRQQRKLLNKIMNNSKHFNNAEKNVFRQRFNSGENFNTIKSNAIKRAQNLKAERVRKEKELLEEQEKKRIRNEQQRLLSKILNNSKNMTNENKVPFLQRFNKGENFNTVKGNAIRKAQNLKRNRIQKEKNELNRKAKEEANRLAKEEANRKAKEEANRLAKEEANRLAKEKANQNAKNEANRLAKEEANRKAKEEENRLAKEEANRKAKEEANRLAKEEANRKAKEEANRLAKEEANKIQREKEREEKRRRLTKILGNSKNLTNEDKAAFLKRFENGENVNTVKANAISKAKELAKVRKNKEETNRLEREKEEAERIAREREEKRLAKEEANRLAKEKAEKKLKEKRQKAMSKLLNSSKNLTNANKVNYLKRFENGENYNALKQNVVNKIRNLANQRKKKEEEERKAKEEANRLAKEEANKKEREKKQQLLSKILNNSKNLTNTNKVAFLKRFENGEKFDTIKKNAISKAKELAKQRKAKEEEERKAREKEEANRKAKEEMIEKKKAEALAKKKKEEEEKKKKEAENKKKAAQNQQMRASLTKKVKSTQMDQKVKNKLLNQLKNYGVQIRNIAPSIEKVIESEKLNGNYNEAANRKKRQEVKKQLAEYISKTYPNMTKADRKKYINNANLTQWRIGIFSGSQGMEANKAFNRIKGNIKRNMDEKKRKNVQAKLIKAMQNKPPPPPKNTKANLKKLVNNTMKGRAAKNISRLKKNINEGVSEMTVKTRLAQLNKQTKYQQK